MIARRPHANTSPARRAGGRFTTESTQLLKLYQSIRQVSMDLRAPLSPEDCQVQPSPDASPTKWHLAHTTWFFEHFLLEPHAPGYRQFHEHFSFLFNSYYNAVGPRLERPSRGIITRPSLAHVEAYRAHVDAAVAELFLQHEPDLPDALRVILETGLNHEQQHQELILTDIKHLLWCNPLRPAFATPPMSSGTRPDPASLGWRRINEGLHWIGHEGDGFAYDNESPRHRVFLNAFEIAARAVTCAEYREFIDAGGYRDPLLWLDEGWSTVQREGWRAPLYWEEDRGDWRIFTLGGMQDLNPAEPVCHLSYFEADAFARWAGARLPTEAEWEVAARASPIEGNFLDSRRFHPLPQTNARLYGDVWQWTRSQYSPYPGYTPPAGALGEYNGKFMCNQFVLRGGSCATPQTHVRATYRNFFPPHARWQFSGVRFARDAS